MKKIVVGSKNQLKIDAGVDGFRKMFPDEPCEGFGVSAASGVSDQPKGEEETFTGALNRAQNSLKEMPEADFGVGIEGGIEERNGEMLAYAWIVVCSKDGKIGKGRSSTFILPPPVAELIRQGKELGEADDIVFGRTNSKQANGAVGLLTGDVIVRRGYYTEASVLAWIPFKNTKLYFGE
ncbi:inosine/xanthosine triphosphatase [Candidatus Uhrbacteria bacterium]|nr:inosine/xanthosine triphosphatase [Candidatus Uhrbacteria bacterium]